MNIYFSYIVFIDTIGWIHSEPAYDCKKIYNNYKKNLCMNVVCFLLLLIFVDFKTSTQKCGVDQKVLRPNVTLKYCIKAAHLVVSECTRICFLHRQLVMI